MPSSRSTGVETSLSGKLRPQLGYHLTATALDQQIDARALAPADVEPQVSFPIETALSGLQEVARLRLPVLRDGKVIGIVSRADLIAAIARSPAMLV